MKVVPDEHNNNDAEQYDSESGKNTSTKRKLGNISQGIFIDVKI